MNEKDKLKLMNDDLTKELKKDNIDDKVIIKKNKIIIYGYDGFRSIRFKIISFTTWNIIEKFKLKPKDFDIQMICIHCDHEVEHGFIGETSLSDWKCVNPKCPNKNKE